MRICALAGDGVPGRRVRYVAGDAEMEIMSTSYCTAQDYDTYEGVVDLRGVGFCVPSPVHG